MGGWGLALKNIFLPEFCKACGVRLLTEDNGFFCPGCWVLSPRIVPPLCTKCGKPHTASLNFGPAANYPCADCREGSARTVRYRRIVGAAYYQDAVEQAIKLFKFQGRRRLAGPLAELMAEAAERELGEVHYDWVAPVPLYRVRQRERGYNQAALLADAVMAAFPDARRAEPVARIRPTQTQSLLKSEQARRENVRGAFAMTEGARVKGAQVLLIDDVVTTAGTVNECAAVLRRAGAAAVDVLSVALAVTTEQGKP